MNALKVKPWRTALFCLFCFVSTQLVAQPSAADKANFNQGNNVFAFNLLKQIAKEQPTQNIFISPFSISTALQMVSCGAEGETKSEIQKTLQTASLSPAKLNAVCKSQIQSLNSNYFIVFNLADGIWCQKGINLKRDFALNINNFFQTDLKNVDFNKPESAKTINDWVSMETQGKINDIASFPFPDTTRLVLANAIYFKGRRQHPFDESLTKPKDFYRVPGIAKQVLMMSKDSTFNYQEGAHFQAVQLDYGDDMQMSLFLPATNTIPEQLLAEFSSQDWNAKLSGFSNHEVILFFPKFKFDYKILLNDALKQMGIKQAFEWGIADFSAMSDESLYISEVIHSSFVAVDEEGTEAAAATIVPIASGGEYNLGNAPKPFEMIIDRPFLFVISKLDSGPSQTILFMGIVNDPKTEN